jgi:hypothetical protein
VVLGAGSPLHQVLDSLVVLAAAALHHRQAAQQEGVVVLGPVASALRAKGAPLAMQRGLEAQGALLVLAPAAGGMGVVLEVSSQVAWWPTLVALVL